MGCKWARPCYRERERERERRTESEYRYDSVMTLSLWMDLVNGMLHLFPTSAAKRAQCQRLWMSIYTKTEQKKKTEALLPFLVHAAVAVRGCTAARAEPFV